MMEIKRSTQKHHLVVNPGITFLRFVDDSHADAASLTSLRASESRLLHLHDVSR